MAFQQDEITAGKGEVGVSTGTLLLGFLALPEKILMTNTLRPSENGVSF
jgi:hypothetical protein